MIKFQKYDSYKDSGLEWLGEIPSEWFVNRIKNIGTVRGRVGWKALKASEYVEKSEYIFIATPNIKHKDIDFNNVNYLTKERYEESPEIMLKINDIVLTKDGSTLGTVNIVNYLPSKTTVNSSIAVVRFKTIDSKFMFYQIKSEYIQNIVKLKKDGAGVPHLFQKDINDFKMILPPLKTQTKIASYLDTQTQKIDKEIQLLEEKSLKYKELKQTLINETVLRGLDRGVEFETKRGKDIFIAESKSHFQASVGEKKGKVKFFTSSQVQNKWINKAIYKNESLIFGTGGIANIHYCYEEFSTSTDCYTLYSKKENIKFLYYYFKSNIYKLNILGFNGSGLRHLQKDFINLGIVLIPNLKDQTKIATYLDEKTQKIDAITKTIARKITLLKEFRKTLINDTVTGKVKVCD